jgi:hypothetical protein
MEDMVMDGFDFSPLFRSTIGFDRLVCLLDAAPRFPRLPRLTTSRRPVMRPIG